MRIFSAPHPDYCRDAPNNGIHQVVLAFERHNPDWQHVHSPKDADLIISHAGAAGNSRVDAPLLAVCHGLHPTGNPNFPPSAIHYQINRTVIDDLIIANETIVPSQWVADILRRDMYLDPHIVHWGINLEAWAGKHESRGYVLWNKNRLDPVCDPAAMQEAARRLGGRQFVSTYGNPTSNLKVVGRQPYDVMAELVKSAGVYLSTTKETGDIGSREALAAGVPVVAFEWGAVTDFLVHGVNGVLVPPNDIEALVWGIEYAFKYRGILSQNAREMAKGYGWEFSMPRIRNAVEMAFRPPNDVHKKATVVIPCYNYARFLEESVMSVAHQQYEGGFEIIIVDDGSTDNTPEVAMRCVAWGKEHYLNIRFIRTLNKGVAHARNLGISESITPYVACMDADDAMAEGWLQTCANALDASPHVGIAYTRLQLMSGGMVDWLSLPFDYERQIRGQNQIPTCAMFRRADALRVGGYRQYMKPAEDADFFTRLLTFTGKRAVKASEMPLFVYRVHEDSVTAENRRTGQPDPFVTRGMPTWGELRPIAAPPDPKHKLPSNPIRTYDNPVVEIIVDPECTPLTLDSLEAQTETAWAYAPSRAPLVLRVKEGDVLYPEFLKNNIKPNLPADDGLSYGVIMAKACCGRIVPQRSRIKMSNDDYVLARYMGDHEGKKSVPSPTQQRHPENNARVVYRVSKGSVLLVHKADIKAAPQMFVPAPPPEESSFEVVPVFKQPAPPVLVDELREIAPEPKEEKRRVLSVNLRTLEAAAAELEWSEQRLKKFIKTHDIQPAQLEGNRRFYDIIELQERVNDAS